MLILEFRFDDDRLISARIAGRLAHRFHHGLHHLQRESVRHRNETSGLEFSIRALALGNDPAKSIFFCLVNRELSGRWTTILICGPLLLLLSLLQPDIVNSALLFPARVELTHNARGAGWNA